VEAQIVDANITRIRWATQYLEEILQRFDNLFYSLQIDEEFIEILETVEESATDTDTTQRELARLLANSYYSYSAMLDRLTLYIHATGRALQMDNVASGRVTYPDLTTRLWDGVLEGPIPLSIRRSGGNLYAIHTINRFSDQSFRGAMVARIDERLRETVLTILASDGDTAVYLLNDAFDVLVASPGAGDPAELLEHARGEPAGAMTPIVKRTETALLFYQPIRRGRLTVIKTVPLAIVTGSSSDTVTAGLLTGGVLVAVSLLLSIVFSLRISRPIVQLADSMREATIPAFVDRHGQDRDEIRQLQEGYEALIARVKSLVQKEYEQEMELKVARLLALQAQINPHFLNNTLNLLGGMAVAKGVPEIYQIARAVGDMFRYAAEADRDLVTLNQELAHVKNYLLIQEHRFAGRCSTTVDVDVEAYTTRIPRFTLQPLVENAFEHGLQGKKGKWSLTIRGRRQRRGTIIVVEDNGKGMSPETVRKLRSGLRNTEHRGESTHNIGLRNVDARLRLHFGERYGLRIFGTSGGGARIVVVLANGVAHATDPTHEV
jgi:two-component system sensor histidine kinase YesM|nr:sensor histidine kinase [Spirochaeta sp.]